MEKIEAAKILRRLKTNTEEDLEEKFEVIERVLHDDNDKKLARKCMDDICIAFSLAIEALEMEAKND